jgi:hypothetical protein
VLGRDVVDQLEHGDRLADAGAAEQADLAALGERADQVDDLDAGLEQLDRGRELVELRRELVDRAALLGLDRAAFIDRRRPSEEPSAMQRTTPSPSCCSTSKVRPFSTSELSPLSSRVSAS